MGSSSSKEKNNNKDKEIIKNNEKKINQESIRNNNIIDKNYKKMESAQHVLGPKNEEINPNIPIKTFQSKISAPIQEKKNIIKNIYEKDYNLEITNYFNTNNNNISYEKKLQEDCKIKFQQILNKKINRIINSNNDLDKISLKINSDFGLQKSIQDDFLKTKTLLLYCSTLDYEDEKFINSLDYIQYLADEKNYKFVIESIINKNIEEINRLIK